MNRQFRILANIALASAAGALWLAMPVASVAQTTNSAENLDEFLRNDASDPFSGRGSERASGVMDMVQRAILAPSRNMDAFAEDQQELLDEATRKFRELQRQRLQQQNQAVPGMPDASGQPNAN